MDTTVDPPTRARDATKELEELRGVVLEQRYEVGERLGSGGMGAVFRGVDERLGREVAIKIMRRNLAVDAAFVERFLREARAASKIRHRNVVVVLDYGETTDGLVFSVMELLRGQDLEALLRARPGQRMPWTEACGLLVQIASGLAAAHAEGVIHRDIKPANCLIIEEDGESVVKLLDFGIAKVEETGPTQQLTGSGDVLGTPSYIAPELVRTHSRGSPQSDVYSLGVVAYRMLAGRVPFTAETSFEVMRRACMDPVPSLREHAPSVPAAVEDFVRSMLAKEPEERPADMQRVRARLQALAREESRAPTTDSANLGASMLRKLSSELPRLQGGALSLLSQHIVPPGKGGRDKAGTKPKVDALEEINRALRRTTRGAARVFGDFQEILQGPSDSGSGPSAAEDEPEDDTAPVPGEGDDEQLTTTVEVRGPQEPLVGAVAVGDERSVGEGADDAPAIAQDVAVDGAAASAAGEAASSGSASDAVVDGSDEPTVLLEAGVVEPAVQRAADPARTDGPATTGRSPARMLVVLVVLAVAGYLAVAMLGS